MVSTRSTPSKRPAAAAAGAAPAAPVATEAASRSTSRAEQTTASIHSQISAAIPSTIIPTAPADLPSLPTLDDASPAKTARSYLMLAGLVFGCVGVGWYVGFDMLQVSGRSSMWDLAALLSGVAVVLLAVLHWVGIASIDFWAMLNGYWWMSVPLVVAALAAVTVMQERGTALHEVE